MQLFIVIIFSQVIMVMAINGCHSDRDKDHRLRENCTQAGFNNIPAGLTHSTKVLLFPRNLFTSLTWSTFQVFTELYEIDLTHNKIPQVTPTASPILPSLTVLRLGSNILTSLPEGSFSACPHLTELYLDNNAIKSLSDHTFSGLSKLEILDLSSNHISILPKLLLHPLPSIETLYIENNKIMVMPDDWFSTKTEVPYLYLSANPWTCLCSIHYLRMYLEEYEDNVYTRDGKDIKTDVYSVVCDSPGLHKDTPVISLDESDLCSSAATVLGPTGDFHLPRLIMGPTTKPPFGITTSPSLPVTTSVITTASSTSASTAAPWTPQTELSIADHSVVTRSWYQCFTMLMTRTHYSKSAASVTEPRTSTAPLRPQSRNPTTTTTNPTTPTEWTTSEPSTILSTTHEDHLTQTSIPISSWVVNSVAQASASKGVGVFCFWLFAACLVVYLIFMMCVLVTLVRLVIWYKTMYKPLKGLIVKPSAGRERARLLTIDRKELVEEGLSTHYRSVLFVHTEGKASEEVHGGENQAIPHGEVQRPPVMLELPGIHGTPERRDQRGNVEEALVYRKTVCRLIGKEEELGAWRDVVEECQMTAKAGKKEGELKDEGMDSVKSGEAISGKCYSLILRENVEQAGGEKEEVDWVIGGWQFKRGGREEEPRISWGQWLTDYLPSMPWGLNTSPESRAAH